MLWILLIIGGAGTVIFLFMIVVGIFSSDTDWWEIRNWAIKMVVCIAIGAIGLLGLYGIASFSYDEVVQTNEWELISLTDNRQISGNGSGGLFYLHISIETNDIYSFYYKVDEDGFKRGTVKAESTIIYEKEECTPHVVEYTHHIKNKMNGILRIVLGLGYGESSSNSYEIYVPKGTILRTISLDTK